MKHHNKNTGGGTFVGMILGAAATIGAYFLLKDRITPEHKERLKDWMQRMNEEIKEKARGMKEKSQEGYHQVVDKVAEKYREYKDVDSGDLERYVNKMKGKWRAAREAGDEEWEE